VPCAFIELKPSVAAPAPEELTSFCRERLAGFKVPKRFVFRELPKTATGKIQKFALRSELARAD
jgi:fatty-acyl-CoA synthase